MKILMVISQFHPIVGGAEKQALLLSQTLNEMGHGIKVVTGWWLTDTPRREMVEQVSVIRNFSVWGMFGIKGLRSLGRLLYMVTLFVYLLIHRREYDLIHVHQALHPAFVAVSAGKLLNKPVVVKTASSGMTSDIVQLGRFPFGKFQLKYLLKNMNTLVVVTRVSGQEYIDLGFSEGRIIYIPNGTRISSTRKTEYGNVRHVVAIGRLSREKGLDILLRAWKRLAEKSKYLKLIILGDGPEKVSLQAMAHSLLVSDSIEFLGNVVNVSEYLVKADIFVLPSRTEGLSNALLEAMGHGLPCIVTQVGGNADILYARERDPVIDKGEFLIGNEGILIRPEDVVGMAAAISRMIDDQPLRERLGRQARQLIEEFYSIEKITERYINLYESLLGSKDV